jgi:hypothetical protein
MVGFVEWITILFGSGSSAPAPRLGERRAPTGGGRRSPTRTGQVRTVLGLGTAGRRGRALRVVGASQPADGGLYRHGIRDTPPRFVAPVDTRCDGLGPRASTRRLPGRGLECVLGRVDADSCRRRPLTPTSSLDWTRFAPGPPSVDAFRARDHARRSGCPEDQAVAWTGHRARSGGPSQADGGGRPGLTRGPRVPGRAVE